MKRLVKRKLTLTRETLEVVSAAATRTILCTKVMNCTVNNNCGTAPPTWTEGCT